MSVNAADYPLEPELFHRPLAWLIANVMRPEARKDAGPGCFLGEATLLDRLPHDVVKGVLAEFGIAEFVDSVPREGDQDSERVYLESYPESSYQVVSALTFGAGFDQQDLRDVQRYFDLWVISPAADYAALEVLARKDPRRAAVMTRSLNRVMLSNARQWAQKMRRAAPFAVALLSIIGAENQAGLLAAQVVTEFLQDFNTWSQAEKDDWVEGTRRVAAKPINADDYRPPTMEIINVGG